MPFYLYQYTNRINGKSYIGITMDLKRRHKEHGWQKVDGAIAFQRATNLYGLDSFDFITLAILNDVDEAARMEQSAIIRFDTLSPNGYNLVAGSPGSKYLGPQSEETKIKRSLSNKGKKQTPEQCARKSARWYSDPKFQKQYDEMKSDPETQKKLEIYWASRKGVPRPQEVKDKMSAAFKGRIITPEWRAKISAGGKGRIPWNKGVPMSPETKAKQSAIFKGKPWSDARLESYRKARKGKPWSPARREAQNKRNREKSICPAD